MRKLIKALLITMSSCFILLSKNGWAADGWTCVTERTATCNRDACQFSDAGDEPPHFSFSIKRGTFEFGFGNGSQYGRAKIIQTTENIVVINTRLGPVKQGSKVIAPGRADLFIARINKKTKRFTISDQDKISIGSCD
jgi:hypothetical protein